MDGFPYIHAAPKKKVNGSITLKRCGVAAACIILWALFLMHIESESLVKLDLYVIYILLLLRTHGRHKHILANFRDTNDYKSRPPRGRILLNYRTR
jgi:hypothetical protein